VDPSYLNEPVAKRLLLMLPIRSPNSQDFVRVYPDPNYRLTPAVLIKLKEGGEYFLVHPTIVNEVDPTEYFHASLFLYVNKQKVPAFWPVRLPDPDGKLNPWHESAGQAVQQAMKAWVRVVANKSLGGYDVLQAMAKYSEPEWPQLAFSELLKLAFKDRLIDSLDHPVLLKLRGLA
jgi:hypothetical protein